MRVTTWLDRHTRALMLVPPFLFILLVVGYPLAYSIWVSFVRFNGSSAGNPFVGLRNYRLFLDDAIAHQSLLTTGALAGTACAAELVLGLALAVTVTKPFRGRGALVVVCVLPLFVSPVIAARLWLLLLREGDGPVNFLASRLLGHPLGIDWTVTPWAYVTVTLVDVWQWTPLMFLILLAGLTSIPRELHEAADLDGAKPAQSMRSITLPLIVPFIALAVVVRLIDATKLFDVPYTVAGGNPDLGLYTISYYLYREGFLFFYQDFAAAGSWLIVLVVLAVSLPLLRHFLRAGSLA